jgi:hypothetical protein
MLLLSTGLRISEVLPANTQEHEHGPKRLADAFGRLGVCAASTRTTSSVCCGSTTVTPGGG